MSIQKVGLSIAMTTFALLSGVSAASAHTWLDNHYGDGDYYGHGRQQQCFQRYEGIRCFWR